MAGNRRLGERTGLRVHRLGCLLLEEVEHRLRPLGLASRSYFVLDGIDRDPPPSQQDLARALGIDANAVVIAVDDLERAGFVVRRRNTADRRRYDLHLTDAGRSALSAAHDATDDAEQDFFGALDAGQRDALDAALRVLLRDKIPLG